MSSTTDPATLLVRAAAGDRDAFASFYDQTSGQVYRLALLTTGAAEPAAELCRATYLRAWREAGRYDARTSPLAWLLALTRGAGGGLTSAA